MSVKAPNRGPEVPAFCGRAVGWEDVETVREIVRDCRLSRTELAATVCELLEWRRPSGRLKRQECVSWLERMEALGWWRLPVEKRRAYRTARSGVAPSPRGEPGAPVAARLGEVRPVELILVETPADLRRWKELVSRYHYLGHRVPFGAALRYFIRIGVEGRPTIAGCLRFSSPAWRVEARDRWIGWSDRGRRERRPRIVANSRFLLLPWVRVKFPAGHLLPGGQLDPPGPHPRPRTDGSRSPTRGADPKRLGVSARGPGSRAASGRLVVKHLERFLKHRKVLDLWERHREAMEAQRRAGRKTIRIDPEPSAAMVDYLEDPRRLMLEAQADPEVQRELEQAGFQVYVEDNQLKIRRTKKRRDEGRG